MTDRDPNTTTILENLFETLRNYSQTRKVSDEELLRQRARNYAEQPDTVKTNVGETLTVLTFSLGTVFYGLGVRYVRSVRPLVGVTRVPNTPPHFMGVVNVRGEVITLLDLSAFFEAAAHQKPTELIVVESHNIRLGLPVKRVQDVLVIPLSEINLLDDTRYAMGVYRHVNDKVVVLDVDEIFRDKRLNSEENTE